VQIIRIDLTGEQLKNPQVATALNTFMSEVQDATVVYIQQLAKDLDVSDACAADVYYLRTRSRHTPELELELIRLHKEGNPPNICDWP
jgi:hypothetical protein